MRERKQGCPLSRRTSTESDYVARVTAMQIAEIQTRLFHDLKGKSDRDCVISVRCWVEYFLGRKYGDDHSGFP